MKIRGDFLGRLAQVGFAASNYGYSEQAQIIFEGISAVRPENVDVLTGLAMAKIHAGHPEEAIVILQQQALKIDPENTTARCFLGFVLKGIGQDSKGDGILHEVIATAQDKSSVSLAKSLLGIAG